MGEQPTAAGKDSTLQVSMARLTNPLVTFVGPHSNLMNVVKL